MSSFKIVLLTHKNLIYSLFFVENLHHFDLFYTEFSFVSSDGQDLPDCPQEYQRTLSLWAVGFPTLARGCGAARRGTT
jgi:hypothetical protein